MFSHEWCTVAKIIYPPHGTVSDVYTGVITRLYHSQNNIYTQHGAVPVFTGVGTGICYSK